LCIRLVGLFSKPHVCGLLAGKRNKVLKDASQNKGWHLYYFSFIVSSGGGGDVVDPHKRLQFKMS